MASACGRLWCRRSTASYTFWIASDDSSLFLSTNESPAGMVPIAQQTSWDPSEDWTQNQSAIGARQSARGLPLLSGSAHAAGRGGDNLSVRWQLPNSTFEQPMSAVSAAGTLLIPCNGVDTQPRAFSQSSNTTVVENLSAALSVLVTNQAPVAYQWFLNPGVKLAGATLPVYTVANASLALNNGQIYTCVITNSMGSITSAPITLAVLRDTVPPA
jgi:hypothetical protein